MVKEKEVKEETKKVRKHPLIRRFLLIAVPIALLIGLVYPLPYYLEVPGTTEPIKQMVKVDGKSDEKKGNFYLTTVQIAQANAVTLIYSHFNRFVSVYSEKDMMGGLSSKEYDQVNQFYMQTAQNMAVYQAFQLADKPYQMKYKGVYVLEVTKNSTFKDDLSIADTLTKINGQTFESSADLIDYVAKQKVGETAKIEYSNVDGSKHKATGKFIKIANGKTGIGISLVDHTEMETTPKVTIDAGSIGGPSAGMMFTLETYAQLTGKDLRAGREIAGTGTMEPDGSIGQIGGVDKKVATASKEGAEIFMVPDSGKKNPDENNYLAAEAAAKKLDTKMKIVPIKTVKGAVTYLETGVSGK